MGWMNVNSGLGLLLVAVVVFVAFALNRGRAEKVWDIGGQFMAVFAAFLLSWLLFDVQDDRNAAHRRAQISNGVADEIASNLALLQEDNTGTSVFAPTLRACLATDDAGNVTRPALAQISGGMIESAFRSGLFSDSARALVDVKAKIDLYNNLKLIFLESEIRRRDVSGSPVSSANHPVCVVARSLSKLERAIETDLKVAEAGFGHRNGSGKED